MQLAAAPEPPGALKIPARRPPPTTPRRTGTVSGGGLRRGRLPPGQGAEGDALLPTVASLSASQGRSGACGRNTRRPVTSQASSGALRAGDLDWPNSRAVAWTGRKARSRRNLIQAVLRAG
jgi:hypothetical protein